MAPAEEQFYRILETLLDKKISRDEHERWQKEYERWQKLTDDAINELRRDLRDMREKDLKELREAILKAQQEGNRRLIAIQGGALLLILSALIPFVIKAIFHL